MRYARRALHLRLPLSLGTCAAGLPLLLSALVSSPACVGTCRDLSVAFPLELEVVNELNERYGSERLPIEECVEICQDVDGAGGGSGRSAPTWSECSLIRIETPDFVGSGVLCEGEAC